jgi:D-xylose transport system permease protein
MEISQAKTHYMERKKFDIRTLTMVVILVVLWLVFTYLTSDGLKNFGGSFISSRNLSNLVRQMTVVGIIGSSMVLIMVSGGIDLSAGSVAGFIGCIAAALQVFYNVGTFPTIIISLVTGALIYVLQGALIAYTAVAPFIVTLGGQLVFKGLVLAVTKGATIAPLKSSLRYFGQAYVSVPGGFAIAAIIVVLWLVYELQSRKSKLKFGVLTESLKFSLLRWAVITIGIILVILVLNSYRGIPIPVLIMVVMTIILTLVAERTTFGRSIYAIGGNLDAAKYSGIKVCKNLVFVYTIHGVMVAIAGLILAARLDAGTATVTNMGLELDAIAAAVIGGTSMTGGVGKVAGALLGALIMASIDNGMSMMNMDAFWQYIVKGIILVAAVWFDIYTRNKKKA